MAARVTDQASGKCWPLLACPDTDASAIFGRVMYRFRINRRSSAYVRLTEPWISKHHGGIDFHDGRWWANDGGSVNTVTVNGDPITEDRPLQSGDVLGFGQSRLLFETDGGPPAPP